MRNAIAIILAFAAAAATAVNVQVPLDDITVNLSALMEAGYYYKFQDEERYHVGYGSFGADTYRLGVNGNVGTRIFYRAEYGGGRNFLGIRINERFQVEAGDDFIPFGVENQTPSELYIASSATSVSRIAPNDLGIRADYVNKDAFIPFGVGLGIYPHVGPYTDSLDAAAARVYADVLPGTPELIIGASYYARQEYRKVFCGEFPNYDYEHKYVFAPRVGGDLGFRWSRFYVQAEYAQYYIEDYLIEYYPTYEPIYKSTYEKGYYGLLAYKQPLPWKYLQAFQPYARYERYEPAVLDRGMIAEDRYTGGFDVYFLDNNLMLRADYTRILEDELRMKNDRIASEFQLFF